jgi:hypothetical protein
MESGDETSDQQSTQTDIDLSETDQTQIEDYIEECEDVFSQIAENLLACIQMIEHIAHRIDQSVIHINYNNDIYNMSDLILQFQKEYDESEIKTNTWGSFVFDKLQECSKIELTN